MISLYAWMPPARGVSGSMVIPSLVTGRGRTRGSPVSGAPASSSSVTPCALASGSSSSRVGLRSPDSSRDRVLTEIPVAADRLARVVSRRRRSARSRGPTAPSVASKSLSIRTILPNRQSSLLSGSRARIVTVARSGKEAYVRKEDRHGRSAARWWILAFIAGAQLMVVLDTTIMLIALPSAQHALGFSVTGRQWVITAYTMAFGGLLLLGGRL